jgi:hypothetical protein
MRVKKKIINMPTGETILLEIESMMAVYPSKSACPLRRADIRIPSGRKYAFTERPDGKPAFTTLKKKDVDTFR